MGLCAKDVRCAVTCTTFLADSTLEVTEVIPEPPPPAANDTAANATDAGAGNATAEDGGESGRLGARLLWAAACKLGAEVQLASVLLGDQPAHLSPGGHGCAGEAGEAAKGGGAKAGRKLGEGPAPEAPPKTRKRTIKAPLNMTGELDWPGMTAAQLEVRGASRLS